MPGDIVKPKDLGVVGKSMKIAIFRFKLHGRRWAALAYSFGLSLDTDRPHRWRRDTLRWGRASSVHSLTGQQDSVEPRPELCSGA